MTVQGIIQLAPPEMPHKLVDRGYRILLRIKKIVCQLTVLFRGNSISNHCAALVAAASMDEISCNANNFMVQQIINNVVVLSVETCSTYPHAPSISLPYPYKRQSSFKRAVPATATNQKLPEVEPEKKQTYKLLAGKI